MKVAVIDNSSDVAEAVSASFQLRWSGASVVSAGTGAKGLELIEAENPQMVILDTDLPDIDGFEVLRRVRRFSQVPVIMLTARSKDTDVARGFELGADDYMVKPFSHIELIARVQNALCHVQVGPPGGHLLILGKLEIDFAKHEVKVGGEPLGLTRIEYVVLYHLVLNEGRVLTHLDLSRRVWGDNYIGGLERLRVHIEHLRRKIGDSCEEPRIIVNQRAVGYMFVRPTHEG